MNNFCSKEWFMDLLKKSLKQVNFDIIVVLSSSIGSTVTVANSEETHNGIIDNSGKFTCRILTSGTYTITMGNSTETLVVNKIVSGLVRKIEM